MAYIWLLEITRTLDSKGEHNLTRTMGTSGVTCNSANKAETKYAMVMHVFLYHCYIAYKNDLDLLDSSPARVVEEIPACGTNTKCSNTYTVL